MDLRDLTEADLVEIHAIYERHCGAPGTNFRQRMHADPKLMIERIHLFRGGSYRVGSRWDAESKLRFHLCGQDLVNVDFNPNFFQEERGDDSYKRALEAGDAFQKEVKGYLDRRDRSSKK